MTVLMIHLPNLTKPVLLLAALGLLAACGRSETDQAPVKLFESQKQALDKAKAVEQQQQERSQELQRKMEEQTQ
jgi:hypothetical protein